MRYRSGSCFIGSNRLSKLVSSLVLIPKKWIVAAGCLEHCVEKDAETPSRLGVKERHDQLSDICRGLPPSYLSMEAKALQGQF